MQFSLTNYFTHTSFFIAGICAESCFENMGMGMGAAGIAMATLNAHADEELVKTEEQTKLEKQFKRVAANHSACLIAGSIFYRALSVASMS